MSTLSPSKWPRRTHSVFADCHLERADVELPVIQLFRNISVLLRRLRLLRGQNVPGADKQGGQERKGKDRSSQHTNLLIVTIARP